MATKTENGKITARDLTKGTVTLDNGHVFTLTTPADAQKWNVGDPVAMTYEAGGGGYTKATISRPAKAS